MEDIFKKRFNELFQQMENLESTKDQKYNSFLNEYKMTIEGTALLEWIVKVKNLLSKACGSTSEHYIIFSENEKRIGFDTHLDIFYRLKAIFIAAKEDYEGGYLRTTRSLIQAEIFESELEQAQELLNSGYLLASAVITGVILESSLRELCSQENINIGKMDKMNSDLAKIGKYNKLQQKRITALADIRNSAAHGNVGNFNKHDVQDMIKDVERFIREYL